jgi:hypothetical protein
MFSLFGFGACKKKKRVVRRRKPCRTRRFRRSNVAGSSCNIKKKADCLANQYCNYVSGGQGCKYIPGGRDLEMAAGGMMPTTPSSAPSVSMSGDEDLGAYADAAGITFFGRKTRCDKGKKRRRVTRRKTPCRRRPYFSRANVPGSSCNIENEEDCFANPYCTYAKGGQGCRYLPHGRQMEMDAGGMMSSPSSAPSVSMSGDEDLGAYAEAAGITFFGRRRARKCSVPRRRRTCRRRSTKRRYNVSGSPCNKLRKGACYSAGCTYSKRGCRRSATYKPRAVTAFGRRCSSSRRRYNVAGSPCNKLRKGACKTAGCTYSKRGCRRSATYKPRTPGAARKSYSKARKPAARKSAARSYSRPASGDSRTGSDACRLRKNEKDCGSNPNCIYTASGCRRKGGVGSKGDVYEGPSRENGYGRKKLPKAFVKKCRKYGIKTTRKVGRKRVPKSMTDLKRQLKRAMRARR